jgi:hypothetical protein
MIARTPTPGTGITLTPAAGTTFSATQGIVGINNVLTSLNNKGQTQDIILDFIRIIITNVGAGATAAFAVGQLDATATASGGTQLTQICADGNQSNTDGIATVFGGVITIGAASSSRFLSGGCYRAAAAPAVVVGDTITWDYGLGAVSVAGPGLISGTGAQQITIPMDPVVIPAGWTYNLLEWATGRGTAFQGEIIVGYIIR